MDSRPGGTGKIVSREELFRQVWETPLSRLAATYGVTGNGLAKICERLSIPCPPRGHWAKKAAGKKVAQLRLPPATATTPASVTITPTPPRPQSKPLSPEQEERAVRVEKDGAITVPDRLTRPHPVVSGWVAEHERRHQEAKRNRGILGPSFVDWTEIDRRRHRFLDALFKAVERHGLKVKCDERQDAYFEFGGERIDFKLYEKQKQVQRPKTAAEMRWAWSDGRTWIRELQPTGHLAFTIKVYLRDEAIRCEWTESEAKPLEEQMSDIVRSFALAGPALVKRSKEREEAERRRLEAERQRQIEAERRKKERNQWRTFREFAQQWEDSERARRFLTILERQEHDPEQAIGGRPMHEWLAWAREQIEKHDPVKAGGASVFEKIGAVDAWTYRD